MASMLRKLLRNQLAAQIFTSFNKSAVSPSPILTSRILVETKPPHYHPNTQLPYPDLPWKEEEPMAPPPCHSSQFYPSFSIGFFLNPISPSGLVQSEVEDVVDDDSPVIWADSVKKKRKRKMNKHKLRKLRKQLRRKS